MKNDIADQFRLLNDQIATSIANKDFVRATALDRARQEILKDICLMDIKSIDEGFFNFVEDCARQNADLIQLVEEDMHHMNWQTSRSMKAKRAYFS
jgi:hypothetical protein